LTSLGEWGILPSEGGEGADGGPDDAGEVRGAGTKHLALLRGAGIVEDDKRGSQVYYSLKCPCILRFFDCVESVLRTSAEEQAALVR